MKCIKKIMIFPLLAFALLITQCASFGETEKGQVDNLAQNPGFELLSDNSPTFFVTTSWVKDGTTFSVDNKVFYEGHNSYKISATKYDDARIEQTIRVNPEKYYKLTCWIKTDNIKLADNGMGANISVKNIIVDTTHVTDTKNEWQYLELIGLTSKDQKTLTYTLGIGGYGRLASGNAWFDSIEVKELATRPVGKKINLLYDAANTPSSPNGSSSEKKIPYGLLFGTLVGILIVVSFFTARARQQKSDLKQVPSQKSKMLKNSPKEPTLDQPGFGLKLMSKKDYLIMTLLTLFYAILAFINLGSFKAPQTFWIPEVTGDTVVIEFQKEQPISRLNYFLGIGTVRDAVGNFRLEYLDKDGKYKFLTNFKKSSEDLSNPIFTWKYVDLPSVVTKSVKIIPESMGIEIRELAFFEDNSTDPIRNIKVVQKPPSSIVGSDAIHLFDEPDKVHFTPSYLNSMYFDEIYHARTAYEYIHGIEPYENTHPPLGKLIISIGISIFGMTPFGFRVMGTLVGVAMVPLMYYFGKRMFQSTFFAFISAFLMAFDFMHFSQSRISTIDSYGTLFIILMYYFMYTYFVKHSVLKKFENSLMPLFLAGLFFGIGSASKWIVLYGSVGLFILYLWSTLDEYKAKFQAAKKKTDRGAELKSIKSFWINSVLKFVLFFVVIPAIVYTLSYTPYLFIKNKNYDYSIVVKNSKDMFDYHSKLKATHPFSSDWWEWPIIRKPLTFYRESNLPDGKYSALVTMGNPAIWWTGIVALFLSCSIAIKKRDKKYAVILIAAVLQFLPWILVPRIAFIYHYFSIVPFVSLSIVYLLHEYYQRNPRTRYFIYAYLGIVFLFFVAFYPVLSGMEVSAHYVNALKWFRYWYF